MNLLAYIEPVVFRENPRFLEAHIRWIARAFAGAPDARLALATSADLHELFAEIAPHIRLERFVIDSWRVLAPFAYRRDAYAAALYEVPTGVTKSGLSFLITQLEEIASRFQPNLVLCTSQNSAVQEVFGGGGTGTVFFEQAPVPRQRKRGSMFLDPAGHQSGSLLNTHAAAILAARPPAEPDAILDAWEEATRPSDYGVARKRELSAHLRAIARGRRIAAFAMQPADWISYEGAYELISPEGLVARWADALPAGWVGVPFFHPTSRFSQSLEHSLASSCQNLGFVREDLAHNALDMAAGLVDALVTISSTTAVTAGIYGARVVVVGKSAFSGIFPARDVSAIDDVEPLRREHRAALLAFLTNRYCHEGAALFAQENDFVNRARAAATHGHDIGFFLDFRDWTADRVSQIL